MPINNVYLYEDDSPKTMLLKFMIEDADNDREGQPAIELKLSNKCLITKTDTATGYSRYVFTNPGDPDPFKLLCFNIERLPDLTSQANTASMTISYKNLIITNITSPSVTNKFVMLIAEYIMKQEAKKTLRTLGMIPMLGSKGIKVGPNSRVASFITGMNGSLAGQMNKQKIKAGELFGPPRAGGKRTRRKNKN